MRCAALVMLALLTLSIMPFSAFDTYIVPTLPAAISCAPLEFTEVCIALFVAAEIANEAVYVVVFFAFFHN